MINQIADKLCFRLHDKTKVPVFEGWRKAKTKKDPSWVNYGVLTGECNDITVWDIDVKDGGVDFWKPYIAKYGEPDTFTVQTGRGGYHYFFKYDKRFYSGIKIFKNGQDEKKKDILVGIDILNGGFAVGHGSIHPDTGKKYKIINDAPINTAPEWLVTMYNDRTIRRCVHEKPKKVHNSIAPEFDSGINRIYKISDDALIKILDALPSEYWDDLKTWLTITCVLKGLNRRAIWNTYSTQSDRYNEANNNDIWRNIEPAININYIINYINEHLNPDKKIKYVQFTKDYEPITNTRDIEEEEINARFLKEYFEKNPDTLNGYDTLIIKSDTGTGKTTFTSHKFKDEEYIISISSRRSLVEQQIETFNKDDIKMEDYRKNINAKKICIQFDSIWKLNTAENQEQLEQSVVYMDELNSSLKYLLRTETMRKKRISIFQALINIIKSAKYVMSTDADISDLCFMFISYFRNVKKTLYINNTHKNYNDITATQQSEVGEMVHLMSQDIKEGRYFVATFDTVSQLEIIATKLKEVAGDANFLKIHSKGQDNTSTENWKNKYVFYSPKIIYGTDFNPPEKCTVYVFCTGQTIDTLEIAQQMTRCRKILNVVYYFSTTNRQIKYETLKAYDEHIKNNLDQYCDILKEYGCLTLSYDCTTFKLEENMFYKMFLYCDYVNKIITSNYVHHFGVILKNKGFINKKAPEIEKEEDKHKITKEEIKELKNMSDDEYETLCDSVINGIIPANMVGFMETINNRMDILKINKYNLTTGDLTKTGHKDTLTEENKKRSDQMRKYKKYIFNDKCLKVHFNLINMFRSPDQLKAMIQKETDYKVKTHQNIYIKCLLLGELDGLIGLARFDMTPTALIRDGRKIGDNDILKKVCDMFNINYDPKKEYTYADIYVIRARVYKKMIGETCNGKNGGADEEQKDKPKKKKEKTDTPPDTILFENGRLNIASKEKGKQVKITLYNINKDRLIEQFEIYQQRDPSFKNIDQCYISTYKLQPVVCLGNNDYLFDD